MEWKNTNTQERIKNWKDFRNALGADQMEALESVATYWGNVPFGSRTLDYYDCQTWPAPWEILDKEQYCQNTISLMVYYTLKLVKTFDTSVVEVVLVDDSQDRYLTTLINKKHILNYELGKVLDINDLAGKIRILDVFDEKKIKQVV